MILFRIFYNVKIGVIDSGIGGLATITDIASLKKGITYFYLCDRANLPYGNKSLNELLQITKKNISYIGGFCPDMVVLACNTLSTMLFNRLKDGYSFEIIPVLPPLSRAKGRTLLLATQNTIDNTIKNDNIKTLALPSLAGIIEEDVPDLSRATEVLKGLDLDAFDTLVLGCTHYRYLKKYLQSEYPDLCVIDGIEDVKKRISTVASSGGEKDKIYYKVTGGGTIEESLFQGVEHSVLA